LLLLSLLFTLFLEASLGDLGFALFHLGLELFELALALLVPGIVLSLRALLVLVKEFLHAL